MDKLTANELRIGNLVKLRGNILDKMASKIGSVTTIYEDNFVVHNHYPSSWYEPIPLTEEWLLRLGFGKDGSEWKLYPCYEVQIIVFNDGSYNGVMFYTRTIHTDYTAIYCTKHINHVHQLQNLYFALTGEELTIKSN